MKPLHDHDVVIVDAVRTAMGKAKSGCYRHVRADTLSAALIDELLARHPELPPEQIDELLWGCVNQTEEQGHNIARNAQLLTTLPVTTTAQTINRLCGSSMSAVHTGFFGIKAGGYKVCIAGGVEHMGHIPMLKGADFNPALSHYMAKGSAMMGMTAEALAMLNGISREAQDTYATTSHQRAYQSQQQGQFNQEIISVMGHNADGAPAMITCDETIRPETTTQRLAELTPAFDPKKGAVTAGNSSQLTDGASALLLMRADTARALDVKPRAKIISTGLAGLEPMMMGLGPVQASDKALKAAGLSYADLDLIELNEAFASQVLAVKQQWKLPNAEDIINPAGGAIALGHPLGCSGTRILTTLLNQLEQRDQTLGLATMCIGMGQGISTVIERV